MTWDPPMERQKLIFQKLPPTEWEMWNTPEDERLEHVLMEVWFRSFQIIFFSKIGEWFVGFYVNWQLVVEPTQLKNLRKSNRIIFPIFGMNIKKNAWVATT